MFSTSDKPFARGRLAVLIVLICAVSLTLHFSLESLKADTISIDGWQACEELDPNEEDDVTRASLVALSLASNRAPAQHPPCQFGIARLAAPLLPPPKIT